jgi:hypothetical protein
MTATAEVTDVALRAMDTDQERGLVVHDPAENAYVGIASSPFTPEQQAILAAPLDENEIQVKPDDGELYMPQVHYRQRLVRAFGMGGWAIRSNGAPVVDRTTTTTKGEASPTVFYTGLLYVGGRFIAEAMGEGRWITSNPKSDYGTALEIAKSNALVRCCKDLGMAWQIWDRSWTKKYKDEHTICYGGKWIKKIDVPKRGGNMPKVTAAKEGAWPKADMPSSVVAADRANAETLAAIVGGPIPVDESVKVHKGDRAATVGDIARHLDKALPKTIIQRLNEAGRIEVTDHTTGEITIEPKASNEQLASIHILKQELQLGDAEYRATLEKLYHVDTSKLLTRTQASNAIERMKRLKDRVPF